MTNPARRRNGRRRDGPPPQRAFGGVASRRHALATLRTFAGPAENRARLPRSSPAAALTRQQGWNAGDALDFQRDLQMYEELLARAAETRRRRKPFEAADHPFVDRCAFLLDSSFMEKARLAASKTLSSLEELATQLVSPKLAPGKDCRTG